VQKTLARIHLINCPPCWKPSADFIASPTKTANGSGLLAWPAMAAGELPLVQSINIRSSVVLPCRMGRQHEWPGVLPGFVPPACNQRDQREHGRSIS
jgi:hypothetical protein